MGGLGDDGAGVVMREWAEVGLLLILLVVLGVALGLYLGIGDLP